MANKSIGKYTIGFGLSSVITSLFSALLTVLKETNEALKTWMKAALGHHWITHGALVLTLFIVLGLVLSNIKVKEKLRLDARKLLIAIIAATIIGGIIIAGLYWTYI